MPKKRNKKQTLETEKAHSVGDEDSVEGDDEVFDGKKYGRRQIRSNWDRYRSESPKLEEEERNTSDHFAALMNAPSDCNYFRFKSERDWESEAVNSSFGGHKLLNLDLELLSNGLACIPFYERVALDKSILSESDIERCNKKAEERELRYKPVVERFLKKLESQSELPCLDKEPQVGVNVKKREKRTEPSNTSINVTQKSETNVQLITKKEVPKSPTEKSAKQVTPGEEDLEDWLDSVLDD